MELTKKHSTPFGRRRHLRGASPGTERHPIRPSSGHRLPACQPAAGGGTRGSVCGRLRGLSLFKDPIHTDLLKVLMLISLSLWDFFRVMEDRALPEVVGHVFLFSLSFFLFSPSPAAPLLNRRRAAAR